MSGRIEYEWKLRELMSAAGMHLTTKLRPELAARGVYLSDSQIYRLVTETPERMNMPTLFALLDIFKCTLEDIAPSRVLSEVELDEAVGDDRGTAVGQAIREGGRRPLRITLTDGNSST